MAAVIPSESDYFRLMRKRADGGRGVSEIEHLRVPVIRSIHLLQGWVSVQHGLSRFHLVIQSQFTGNANPLAVFHRADFRFRICQQLFRHVLDLARLYVEFPLENMSRVKRPHPRLVSFHSRQIINLCVF